MKMTQKFRVQLLNRLVQAGFSYRFAACYTTYRYFGYNVVECLDTTK